MAVVGGAGLCSLHFFDPAIQPSYSSGGILGEFIISLIIDGLGLYGTTLILLALFLSGLTLFTGISWLRTMDKVGVWVIRSWGKLLEWYENFKDRKLEQKSVKESVVKRQEALKQEKEKRETRSPVKIEPKVMHLRLHRRQCKRQNKSLCLMIFQLGRCQSWNCLMSQNHPRIIFLRKLLRQCHVLLS